MLVEDGLIIFSRSCFEFADEVPEEGQHSSLANLPKTFSNHLPGVLKVAVVRFCAYVPPRLLSLLLCCVYLNLHTGSRPPTLCSARALRARGQFGRSGKHDVKHVGGNVTDAGAIGDWR